LALPEIRVDRLEFLGRTVGFDAGDRTGGFDRS
jgi:hypothetical protein